MKLSRYEFTIATATDKGRELQTVQIRGNGGNLGDGCLYITDPEKIQKVSAKLLAKARAELAHTGELRVGFPVPEVLVSTDEEPITVRDCYPVFVQ